MGKDGEIPLNRRVMYKTGMSSTTLDLFDGTTKETHQVCLGKANRKRGIHKLTRAVWLLAVAVLV